MAELQNVDLHLEVENLPLARGLRGLEVAVKLSLLQREVARSKGEESFDTVKEDRAFEEAEAADRLREAAENREHEAQARRATLSTSSEGPSAHEAGLRALKDARAHEPSEQSLEHERLEVMWHHVMAAEASLASWEAVVQTKIDEGVAAVRRALIKDHHRKLKL